MFQLQYYTLLKMQQKNPLKKREGFLNSIHQKIRNVHQHDESNLQYSLAANPEYPYPSEYPS